jgi:hypothetical protein
MMSLRIALCACILGLCSRAFAADFQFFVFPLMDIVGIDSKGKENSNTSEKRPYGPLINPAALDQYLMPISGQGQRRQGRDALVAHFVQRVREAYPQAAVHPRQISEVLQGTYAYIDNAECNSSQFKAPIKDAYAVSLGLTRLNIFSTRSDKFLQIFIPVTLNIQFVKPDGLRSVFTKSHTEYFGREFTLAEALGPDGKINDVTRQILRDGATAAAKRGIDSLLASAKTGFQPKQTEVEVLDWSGDDVVLKGGPEVGFESGQGYDVNGGEFFFSVSRTQAGWTVGRFDNPRPNLRKGLKLKFRFTSPMGRDDSKPDLMPAAYSDSKPLLAIASPDARAAMAEYFSLDIGYKAPFNLQSLNPSLDEVATGIKTDARCVNGMTYEKMAGIGNVSGAKRPLPQYFVTFDVAESGKLRTAFQGAAGATFRDAYRILASARVFDREGLVVHSALAEESVENEVAFGRGLSFAQAREVGAKNAAFRLTRELIDNLKFTPREYNVVVAEKGRVKLANAANANVRNGAFFHPLNIKVAEGRVVVPFDPLEVEVNSDPEVKVDGADLWVTVSNQQLKLKAGDIFRTVDLLERKELIQHCGKPVVEIPNNAVKVNPNVANLTVGHAIATSARFNLLEPDDVSIMQTNKILSSAFFEGEIKPKPPAATCYVPAVWVREESSQCETPNKCQTAGAIGAGVAIERNGQLWKRDMVNMKFPSIPISPESKISLYDIKSFEVMRASAPDLAKKIGGF